MKLTLTVAAAALTAIAAAAQTGPSGGLDTAAIDRAMGKTGQKMGDVYKVSLPRTDLHVTIGDVAVKPGVALGSWVAFRAAEGGAVAHGDLVLTDSEVNPVITELQHRGFEITALHNHLLNETPHVMYLHFWGHGAAETLATSMKAALAHTKTPFESAAAAPPAAANDPATAALTKLEQAVGLKGSITNGVLAMSQARPEKITMMGVVMPPSMGMATSLNFQALSGTRVAGSGDFVMIADEVNRVARALRDHNIAVTALHNHMLHGSPELYFMHFWADGTPEAVGSGIKAAVAQLARPTT